MSDGRRYSVTITGPRVLILLISVFSSLYGRSVIPVGDSDLLGALVMPAGLTQGVPWSSVLVSRTTPLDATL